MNKLFAIATNELGWQVDRKHDSAMWRALKHSTIPNKILISAKLDKYGREFFIDHQGGGGGLKQLLALHDLDKNVHFSPSPYIPLSLPREVENVPFVDPRVFLEAVPLVYKLPNNYLDARKIDKNVQKSFRIKGYYNCIYFPLFSLSTLQVGSYIRYLDKGKLFAKGIGRGNKVWLGRASKQTIEQLIITESPIDALSYFQLYRPEKALFIATCGSLTREFKASIPSFLKRIGVRKVVLAMDNDEAGKRYTDTLSSLLSGKVKVSIYNKYGDCGDLNEVLRAY